MKLNDRDVGLVFAVGLLFGAAIAYVSLYQVWVHHIDWFTKGCAFC